MLRKRIHQLIDQLPSDKLPEILTVLQDYQNYDTYIPRQDGIPVYSMKNKQHIKVLSNKYLK